MRKFKQLLFLLCISSLSYCQAQNLVPNPSFEIYSDCPWDVGGSGQLYFATPWLSYCWSPDYFNPCATSSILQVPSNYWGYQYARTGESYAGLYVYHCLMANEGREYAQVELIQTLEAGVKYYVEFHVSLADKMTNAISSLGCYFSSVPIHNPGNFGILPFLPQVKNKSTLAIIEKEGWTCIADTFTAIGNEKFLLIGNFDCDSLSGMVILETPNNWCYTYYYIDDVKVIADSLNITEPVQPIDSIPEEINSSIFIPNVFSPNNDGINDMFYVRGENIDRIDLKIYNRWGQIVFENQEITVGWDGKYNSKSCDIGVYFYFVHVIFKNGAIKKYKGNVTLVR